MVELGSGSSAIAEMVFSDGSPTCSSSSSIAPELDLGLNGFSEPIAIVGLGRFTAHFIIVS